MLKKKSAPVPVRFALSLPQSVCDRIERVRQVAEANGYELSVEDTLVRSVTIGVTRWEKRLKIGSNAVPAKGSGAEMMSKE